MHLFATSLLLVIIGRIFNSVMDILQHHHGKSIFKNTHPHSFWGSKSWVRKYKNNDPKQGAKFFGSTTILVFLTDGWHLCQLLMFLSYEVAVAIHLDEPLIFIILSQIIGGLVFELFYTKIWRKDLK